MAETRDDGSAPQTDSQDSVTVVVEDAHDDRLLGSFMELGRAYLAELDDTPPEINERFLASIVRRLREKSERWLLMALVQQRPCAFCYCMVDRRYRPGSGFIAEFYVDAKLRRQGIGTRLHERAEALLTAAGARSLWLTTNQTARPFWESRGMAPTGEVEDNGYPVMAGSLSHACADGS